jgi:hypothetical protein
MGCKCKIKFLHGIENFVKIPFLTHKFYIFGLHVCLGGGIGRRAGFKIQCWQQRVGSIPTQGTFKNPNAL